jgi:hypothetical protein
MYEHKSSPLLSPKRYFLRLLNHFGLAVGVVAVSLGLGILGYHDLENLSWLDSLLNASMILGGMGPVNALHTDAGKLFASAYALFSGVVFLVVMGVLFAPVLHRLMHRFHWKTEENKQR